MPDLHKEMNEAIANGSQIGKELIQTFGEEERFANTIGLGSDGFETRFSMIPTDSLAPLLPLKESRESTYKGLGQSVRELGVLTPIHVMESENYKRFLEEGHDDSEWNREEFGDKYILIDGFRRVWAAIGAHLAYIPAIIWKFQDMDQAMDIIIPLSMMLTRGTKRNIKETWGLFQLLEETSTLNPSTLEYLLQLEPGDAMRLKDVMMSEYVTLKYDLMNEKKTLKQAYNILNKYRKEQDELDREEQHGLSEIEASQGLVLETTESGEQRSYQEIRDILNIDDEDIENMTDDDFIALAGKEGEGIEIDRRKGEDIPRELKQAALARDNYTCQVSGTGLDANIPMTMGLSVLQVHHIIPLYLGGKNVLENLITLRMDIHTWVHVIERLNGKLGISRDTFEKLDKQEQKHLKGALELAKKITEEAKRQGRSTADRSLQQASYRATQFKMPGTDLKENVEAISN